MTSLRFWKSAVLSVPIVMGAVAFAMAADATLERCSDVVVSQVAAGADVDANETIVKALEQPNERFALPAPPVALRESSTSAPCNTAALATFQWSLLATGFVVATWWFHRIVSTVPL